MGVGVRYTIKITRMQMNTMKIEMISMLKFRIETRMIVKMNIL